MKFLKEREEKRRETGMQSQRKRNSGCWVNGASKERLGEPKKGKGRSRKKETKRNRRKRGREDSWTNAERESERGNLMNLKKEKLKLKKLNYKYHTK